MQFRMGSHALPVEQGRLARPAIRWHCTGLLCATPRHCDEKQSAFHCDLSMKGTLFFIAPNFSTSAATFGHCTKMVTVPCTVLCGAATRRLCLFSTWLMAPPRHVHIGQCWLNGLLCVCVSLSPSLFLSLSPSLLSHHVSI